MNPWIRRGAFFVAGLVVLAGAGALLVPALYERKSHRVVDVPLSTVVAYRTDAAAVERGRYLFNTRGCAECHGPDGRGVKFINDPAGFVVKAPNISPGPGGVVAAYRPEDWERTLRHGVKPDGRPVFIMPSEDYNRLTDADLAALVAYTRQLAPVAGEPLQSQVPLIVKALYAVGQIRDAAENIDHRLPPSQPVPEAVSVEHGAYVANACLGCHGQHLSGGKIPGTPPDWPPAANLTPGEGSAMTARYASAEAFAAMLRSGQRPDGTKISDVMPFNMLTQMSDTDVAALHLYLKSVPARPAGER